MPRTLLVTWTPPGDRNVGEIILRDLCSLLPDDAIRVCEVSNFPALPSRYENLRLKAPIERLRRQLPGGLGALLHHLRVRSTFRAQARALIEPIARYAQEQQVERVWLVLSSQALITIGREFAERLRLPMFSLVWDAPAYLAQDLGWDSLSIAWTRKNFAAAMRASTRCMVVSDAMVEKYQAAYDVPCVVVRHAFEPPGTSLSSASDRQEWRIGFAGSMHEKRQLDLLITALNDMHWQHAGRPIRLRMIGNHYRFTELSQPACIELLGWQSNEQTRSLLADCDLCYLPVPFGAHFREFAELSFPTKMSTYLAAGRPILMHGPPGAPPLRLNEAHQFGVSCTSMNAQALGNSLQEMLDPERCSRLAQNAQQVCQQLFTRAVMRRQFGKFLGIDETDLAP